MPASGITDKQKITKLEAENQALKNKLQKTTQEPVGDSKAIFKKLFLTFVIGFAGALLVVGNLVFWTGRTITNSEKYVAATQPLIENQDIQKAIAKKSSDAIFSTFDIEQMAKDILPERADFLAPSIASQSQNYVNSQIYKLVGSKQFQSTWQTVNARAHQRLLDFVTNYRGDGNFDINDLYGAISNRLVENNQLTFLANKTLPSSVGNITLISTPNLPKAHWLVVNLWWIRLTTILLFILLTAFAVWLAKNKRKAIVKVSLLYSSLMLFTLLALRISRTYLVGKISPDFQAAATAVWDIILKSLTLQTISLALAFIFIALVAWVGGQSSSALKTKSSINRIVNGQLHSVIFKGKENKFTLWMGQNKKIIESIVLFFGFISLLIISLTPTNLLVLAAILLLTIIIIESLSSPVKNQK